MNGMQEIKEAEKLNMIDIEETIDERLLLNDIMNKIPKEGIYQYRDLSYLGIKLLKMEKRIKVLLEDAKSNMKKVEKNLEKGRVSEYLKSILRRIRNDLLGSIKIMEAIFHKENGMKTRLSRIKGTDYYNKVKDDVLKWQKDYVKIEKNLRKAHEDLKVEIEKFNKI